MFSKLKQFKDLRQQAKQMQSQLSQESFTGEALSGRLKMTMDGTQKVLAVSVDPGLLNPDKQKTMEDGIKDLVENTLHQMQKSLSKKMRAGELKMPDMSGLGM